MIRRAARRSGFAGCNRGNVLIEMALITPVLCFALLGLIEYGMLVHQSTTLENAARAGAEYAVRYPSDSAGIAEAVSGSSGLDAADLEIVAVQFCECPDGSPVDCGQTCSGADPNIFVSVTVRQPGRSVLEATGLFDQAMLSGSAVLRAR